MKIFTWDGLPVSHSALLKAHGGENVVVVMPSLVRALKGHGNAAILLSQLLYWSARSEEPNGWFYNNRDKLSSQTGIGKDGLTTARALLRKLGILEETRAGMPAKLYMRLNLSAIARLIESQEKPPPSRVTDMPPQQELRAYPANMSAGHTPSARVMGMPGSLSKEEKITKRLEEEITEEMLCEPEKTSPSPPPPTLSTSTQPDSQRSVDLQTSVLKVMGKTVDFQMGAVSPKFRSSLNQLVAKLGRDGRTPRDVETVFECLPIFFDSDPETFFPPTPAQLLDIFDAVLKFGTDQKAKRGSHATYQSRHGQPYSHNQPKFRMPARVANDEAAAERFIARRRERAANANR